MEGAGLEAIEIIDVTEDFHATAQAWFDAFAARAAELRSVLRNDFDDRQKGRKEMIAAVDEGLLQRLLVSASAPGP
jgi:hypothetical protein